MKYPVNGKITNPLTITETETEKPQKRNETETGDESVNDNWSGNGKMI